jgi:hypothetical protein
MGRLCDAMSEEGVARTPLYIAPIRPFMFCFGLFRLDRKAEGMAGPFGNGTKR